MNDYFEEEDSTRKLIKILAKHMTPNQRVKALKEIKRTCVDHHTALYEAIDYYIKDIENYE